MVLGRVESVVDRVVLKVIGLVNLEVDRVVYKLIDYIVDLLIDLYVLQGGSRMDGGPSCETRRGENKLKA